MKVDVKGHSNANEKYHLGAFSLHVLLDSSAMEIRLRCGGLMDKDQKWNLTLCFTQAAV